LLEKMANEYNYELQEIPKHVLDEISISSTRIREALLEGKIEIADKLLGYEFFFSGTVVDGDKLGKKLGYPTANLKIEDEEKITPGIGIYAVYAEINNERSVVIEKNGATDSPFSKGVLTDTIHHLRYKGMMSIGFRPTVDGKKRVIEVNIFDFDKEIYGETVKVFVKKFLREEVKFDNLHDLVNQIDQDKIESLKVL
jgi:riboflavin kinase/FMN adenylyltransferase